MTKQELIDAVADYVAAENDVEVTKADVTRVLDGTFAVFANALQSGEKVGYPGFGSFQTKTRSARQGRNPQTGEPLQIPASRYAKFTASKNLKETLNA